MTTTPVDCDAAHQELLANAVRLQPLLRESVLSSEAMRRLPDETVETLTDAGFFRLLKPHRFGGLPVGQRTMLELTEALGAANASAAWLVSITAGGTAVAKHGSERAQSEVFSSPDSRIAGGLAPGTACRVDGGLLINGSWSYASGPHTRIGRPSMPRCRGSMMATRSPTCVWCPRPRCGCATLGTQSVCAARRVRHSWLTRFSFRTTAPSHSAPCWAVR